MRVCVCVCERERERDVTCVLGCEDLQLWPTQHEVHGLWQTLKYKVGQLRQGRREASCWRAAQPWPIPSRVPLSGGRIFLFLARTLAYRVLS